MKNPLTREQFDSLLAALGPDRTRAGEAYEQLRGRLVKYFRWEGCLRAEDWADETLNRVAQRLDSGEAVLNVTAFASGVARLAVKEALRGQLRENTPLVEAPAPPAAGARREQVYECLERCLARLSEEQRIFILRYYQGSASERIRIRKKMARDLGISLNSLRNRALRLRDRLERCVRTCARGDISPSRDTESEDTTE